MHKAVNIYQRETQGCSTAANAAESCTYTASTSQESLHMHMPCCSLNAGPCHSVSMWGS